MHSYIQSEDWVCVRLPNNDVRVIQFIQNTTINLTKFGVFPANLIIGRPYHVTYEILDKEPGNGVSDLRSVPATEIHADTIAEEDAAEASEKAGGGAQLEIVGDGDIVMRTNQTTIDDNDRQLLSMADIELLKKEGRDSGKDIIAKIMASHTALDEKTAFSLAKYKALKTKKYLKQFTVLPCDVGRLTKWLIEDKDPSRILEMREEMVGLIGCWGNVHYSGESGLPDTTGGRWLVVDEAGGLLVAIMADRMGCLYHEEDEDGNRLGPEDSATKRTHAQEEDFLEAYATTNTITLVHANTQPNLSLLRYFNFNADTPHPSHPLTAHLRTLTWLQLLQPQDDTTYSQVPAESSPEEVATWKSGKRGTYFRKRRRYLRTKQIVDETRAGEFDGLIIASAMEPVGILKACIPLLKGGAPIVIYSPTIEPLVSTADLYSTSRRTAYNASPPEEGDAAAEADFPLNPTTLLGVSIQTSKARHWQVLPGRTHPFMTARGSAEGYVFTATKVIPAEGNIQARGKYKRRKLEKDDESAQGDKSSQRATSSVATPVP